MKRIISFIVLIYMFCSFQSSAQEKVYLKAESKPLLGEISEIGIKSIKIKVENTNYFQEISKEDIEKIVFANGTIQTFKDPEKDMSVYNKQHKEIIKFALFSPSTNSLAFYYERAIKPGIALEGEFRFIGIGNESSIFVQYDSVGKPVYSNPSGARIGVGYKAIKLPDFVEGSVKLRNILQGSYIKPNLMFDCYRKNIIGSFYNPNTGQNTFVNQRKTIIASTLSIDFGRQWLIGDRIGIDLYTSIGYTLSNLHSQFQNIYNDLGIIDDINSFSQQVSTFGYFKTNGASKSTGTTFGLGLKFGYAFNH